MEKDKIISEDISKMLDGDDGNMESSVLREPEVAYGKSVRREYTVDDYFALPEGVRKELIHGELYDMAAPTPVHQRIVLLLASAFDHYIEENGGKCETMIAPLDVELESDGDILMLQPDILIVCDPEKLADNNIVHGAPDLVVEVLSPSTQKKDRTIKLREYRRAGVRECWLINPERREIEVYTFISPDMAVLPKVYSFESTIPAGIFSGKCRVDFSKIYQRIKHLYDT